MKPFQIIKGKGRLYFDPSTGFIRMDHSGAGPAMSLTDAERVRLALALWGSIELSKRPE